mgnify:CR=1 FL=1
MWLPPTQNPIMKQHNMVAYKQSLFNIDDFEVVKKIETMR